MLLTDDKCYSRITVPYFFLNPKAEELHSQDSLDLSPGLWRSSPRRRCLQMLGCLCLSLLIHKSRRTPWVSVLSLQETSRRRPTGGPSIYVLQPQPWALNTAHLPRHACMSSVSHPVPCLLPIFPTSDQSQLPPVPLGLSDLTEKKDHHNVVTATSHGANCIHTHLSHLLKWKAASLLLWNNPLLHWQSLLDFSPLRLLPIHFQDTSFCSLTQPPC